jgi:hypothetical protein
MSSLSLDHVDVLRRDEGIALPDPLRGDMERLFNADLGTVRVRLDARLPERGVLACATDEWLHVAPAAWAPHTPAGRALLAHELAHVLQQRQGAAAIRHSVPAGTAWRDETLEDEADTWAMLATLVGEAGLWGQRNRAGLPVIGRAPRGAVQCVLIHARDARGKVDWVVKKNGYTSEQATSAKKIIDGIAFKGPDSCTVSGLDGAKFGHESTGQQESNPTNKSVSVWWNASAGRPTAERDGRKKTTVAGTLDDAIHVCGLGTHLDEHAGKSAYRMLWRVSAGLADRFHIDNNTVKLMPAPKPKPK